MAAYELTAPDGSKHVITAPDNATDAEVMRYGQAQLGGANAYAMKPTNPANDPTSTMGTGARLAAGAGSNMQGLVLGGQQATLEADKALTGGKGAQLANALRGGVGMEPKSLESVNAEVANKRKLDAPLLATDAGNAGDIAGAVATTLPAMAIPGTNTVKGAATVNAILGALQPTTADESRIGNATTGAVSGAIGQAGANVAGRVISPKSSQYVKLLRDEGVTPTPGQILGGGFQKAEDKLTSVPILGDAINYSRAKGLDEFNSAALARALKPIGESTDKIGREGMQQVEEKLSTRYNTLLPKLRMDMTPELGQSLSNLYQMANGGGMSKASAEQFDNILKTNLFGKLTPAGTMSGTSFKDAESELSRLARNYGSSSSGDERQLGTAIKETLSSMRKALGPADPSIAADASELKAINEGYANYVRLRKAAGMQGADLGEFTPAQLSSAVKAKDASVDKKKFASGEALMQDLSDAGKHVLASKYPDSGTTGRMLMGGGALLSGTVAPAIPASLAGLSIPYMPGARKLAAALLTDRPEAAKVAAPYVQRLGSAGGATLAPQIAAILANLKQ